MFNTDQRTYQRLRLIHSEQRKPIAFWVGAGLSVSVGLPTWEKLKNDLIVVAYESISGLDENDALEKEQLLERAKIETNYWEAFDTIKKIMGKAEFVASIRQQLTPAPSVEFPELYRDIWRLPGVKAMLTLNLDGFAEKSHRRCRPNEDPVTFTGKIASHFVHVLGARRPFIANLHGIMDDQNSWIFTKSDVNSLFSQHSYTDFLTGVFSNMTVVFAGISAEDIAAGGTLAKLTERGVDLGEHFWITDRGRQRIWASDAGIQIIHYQPERMPGTQPDHLPPLRALFSDLFMFVSKDSSPETILPVVEAVRDLPTSKELRVLDEDDLRLTLSGHAKFLIERYGKNPKSTEYQDFLASYSSNIHQAWHVTDIPPYNKFYGYTVEKSIHTSAFSTIWEIRDAVSNRLALKILRIENLRSGPQIESFRRGVESQEYLTNAAVPGTARLEKAYEIPTSVIMEFVEGASLAQAVMAETFEAWPDYLLIFKNVCHHLVHSHNLPQGVLHRDIRPSNIMLPFAYWRDEDTAEIGKSRYDVKLLNYDMSWHANAKGQAIAGNIEEAGYYAPEQISQDDEASRTTLVDSYGVGMSLFYAFSRISPPTGGSTTHDWKKLVFDRIKMDKSVTWRSACNRLRRIILQATLPDQSKRISVTQIALELELLSYTATSQTDRLPIDFWAEELICRAEDADYEALPNGYEFKRGPRPGRIIGTQGDIRSNAVKLYFKNSYSGLVSRSGIDKVWSEKLGTAREILTSTGWEVSNASRYINREILLHAEMSLPDLQANFEKALQGFIRGISTVRID